MLITSHIGSQRSAINRSLENLRTHISEEHIWRPIDDVQFVFLCGANIEEGVPSKRRQDLIQFSLSNLPHTKFFLAEVIFDLLRAEGHKGNILDIENELSHFADFIILVLESESAFTELGAFASSRKLREKLIVINDLQHKDSSSFIRLGPIKAIEERPSGDQKILYYHMMPDGKIHGDAIGDIYNNLYQLLDIRPKQRRSRVINCNPNELFSKDNLRFIHDLVYFTGPINLNEILVIIKYLFDKAVRRKIENHLSLLCAIKEIKRSDRGMYKSLNKKPYFEYGSLDIFDVIASFKNMYFRYDKRRLK